MKRISNITTQKIVTKIMAWGTTLLFLAAIAIMAYMSFVTNIGLNPSIRNITIIALMALILNYIVWDSRYKADYDKTLALDMTDETYSIHRRYYFARKGLKQTEVQKYIRQYNKDFVQAWLDDVEDETGRTIDEIRNGPYRGNDHKVLIWKIKHHRYPKSGIKRAREVLSVLNVGSSDSMKIKLKQTEHQHTLQRISKLFTSMLSTLLAASITVNFVQGDLTTAFLTLLINIVLLFTSLFFGALMGIKGAKLKLSIAEQVSSLLEEWREKPPVEEPYKTVSAINKDIKIEQNCIDKVAISSTPESNIIEIS